MIRSTLVDTGPLVAYLDRRDRYHDWARANLSTLSSPPLTCEAVITEACFLLHRNLPGAEQEILTLLTHGRIVIAFDLGEEASAVAALMQRYASVPMSLADACLVRMTEIHGQSPLLSLDGDFRVYRKHGKAPIDAILPAGRA